MLGKRAIRTGRTAGRGAGNASAPARPEVSLQACAQPSLATAGMAAIDILPARAGRGLRRSKATSTAAPAVAAPIDVARPVGVLASGAAERRSAESLLADARAAESLLADARAADHGVVEPAFAGRPSGEPGALEPALAAVGPLGTAPAERTEVRSLFVARPAEAADVTEPIGRAEPVTASGPGVGAVRAVASVAGSVAAVALAAQDDAEPEPAPSSLFAPAPSAIVPVAEIVPTAAKAVVAAAEAPLFAPAAAAATSGGDMPAAQSLRERSAMASQALSELSALSSYRPEGQPTTSTPVARRTAPTAAAAAQPAAPGEELLGARRGTRNAADVRSMLSGFRTGGERGRATTAAGASVPEQAPARDQS